MHFKEMIKEAQSKGLANESKMWKSVDMMAESLSELKDAHPDLYWGFMRKQHGLLYNNHYSDEFARYDVSELCYTDKEGKKQRGEHWTKSQVVEAAMGKTFPNGTADCDKYVAYNATYADLCKVLTDKDILEVAYAFWFADEDWHTDTKIWEYFCLHSRLQRD